MIKELTLLITQKRVFLFINKLHFSSKFDQIFIWIPALTGSNKLNKPGFGIFHLAVIVHELIILAVLIHEFLIHMQIQPTVDTPLIQADQLVDNLIMELVGQFDPIEVVGHCRSDLKWDLLNLGG